MTRRIRTEQFHAAAADAGVDGYLDRVLKYIPGEVVALWTAVTGVIASAAEPSSVLLWIVFAIGVILAAAYTWKIATVPNQPTPVTQIVVSAFAFIVWVFAIGGPFSAQGWYEPYFGSVALILWTALAGLIIPKEG
jgi:hypothetical protein